MAETDREELERFLRAAAHDLEAPLGRITGFAQLLARRYKGRLDADADEFVGFIVENCARMKRVLDAVVELGRVTTKAGPLERVELASVARRAVERHEPEVKRLGGSLQVDPLPVVRGDAEQLASLLAKLVDNAVKFRAPERPLAIRVGAERVGELWAIEVRDNGLGIPPGSEVRAFAGFQRLHHAEIRGTGLSLAIAKRIAERHGGAIEARPGPEGVGTVVRVRLPAWSDS